MFFCYSSNFDLSKSKRAVSSVGAGSDALFKELLSIFAEGGYENFLQYLNPGELKKKLFSEVCTPYSLFKVKNGDKEFEEVIPYEPLFDFL